MKYHCLALVFWGLLNNSLVGAQTDGRKPIQEFYDGLSLATEMKFAEGMVSHRAGNFKGLDADGHSFDRWSDLYRFRVLFTRCLAVKLKSKIVDFVQQGDHCTCTVSQKWDFTQQAGKAPSTRVLTETQVVQDTWVWQDGEWKLTQSVRKSRSLPNL